MNAKLDERARVAAPLASERAKTTSGALHIVLRDARLLFIAIWLGAAVFFSFAVAPSAFSILPTHELAGRLVTQTLSIVNIGGFLISLLLLATAFAGRDGQSHRAWIVEIVSLALVTITTAIGHWVINARLLALRVAMGKPIDAVAVDDPLRVAFNNLHSYSVVALTIGMLSGLVALILIARRGRRV